MNGIQRLSILLIGSAIVSALVLLGLLFISSKMAGEVFSLSELDLHRVSGLWIVITFISTLFSMSLSHVIFNSLHKKVLKIFLSILAGVVITILVLIGLTLLSQASYYLKSHNIQIVENSYINSGYENCIIPSDNPHKPDVAKIYVQESNDNPTRYKVEFIDFDGKKYPADINFDVRSGFSFHSNINKNTTAWLEINYKNSTCHLDIYSNSARNEHLFGNIVFKKDGYFTHTYSMTDLGDWHQNQQTNNEKIAKVNGS